MSTLRHQQQIARVLLLHGISGEIHFTETSAFVVVDDPHQLSAATALMAKYFPGAARVVCPIL